MRTEFIIIYLFIFISQNVNAQELTPRAYWPAPYGTKLIVAGYSYKFGDILTDPSLPLTGVDSRIHSVTIAYLQTLKIFGRTSNVIIDIPYVWAVTEADLIEPYERSHQKREVNGLADIGLTVSINLIGAPSMSPEDFQQLRNKSHIILGASIKVQAPTGKYESSKLFNVGTNRWSFKTELGSIIPLAQKWMLELSLGTWFFTNNTEFLGTTRKQNPIGNGQLHLVHRFAPGFWTAFNFNYFWGGSTNLLDEDLQRNSKIGMTLVYPFASRHSLKFNASIGIVTASGDDFTTFLLSYQTLL